MATLGSANGVARLGNILGIWAHPDDESFMMAGLMAVAVQNGQMVACVTATRGEAGSQDKKKWPPATLGQVRTAELAAAFSILGVKHHHWLDYPDGGCCDVGEEEAVERLKRIIDEFQPDTVITFPPDGITGHFDHIAVSHWTRMALKNYNGKTVRLYYAVDTKERYDSFLREIDEEFNVYFNIDRPALIPQAECDLLIPLTSDIARIKCDALAAMPSQMSQMYSAFGKKFMRTCLSTESFVRAELPRQWGKPKPWQRP